MKKLGCRAHVIWLFITKGWCRLHLYIYSSSVRYIYSLINSKPLGAWTTIADGEIVIKHIPFILYGNEGEMGTLMGHVARANDIWKYFSKNKKSIVIFKGDQSYITPSWYPSKQKHGKVVPTWNYVVMHAYGIPKKIEDPKWLIDHRMI